MPENKRFTKATWVIMEQLLNVNDLEEALSGSLEIIVSTLNSEAGAIWLLDKHTARLSPVLPKRSQGDIGRAPKLKDGRWFIFDAKGNAGYQHLSTAADSVAGLSLTFSLFFLIIGALVIYTSVGRIMEEQRKLIGSTKALGLYNREILAKVYELCSFSLLYRSNSRNCSRIFHHPGHRAQRL